ncbi:adenine nucleotide alpha hydrolase [Spirosoma sp. 209]|uniref:adenine nucleotide alpha hydrolase n=1 Tax=Spirosoma sp. 209 TaxID=1955701 RepID=UPI001F47360A|nr:adenine nucleotide alpha hydrolase [Spirosoma sp. 209]
MNRALMNWSGGKDSALALWQVQQSGQYQVETLLTTLNAANRRISMHGVPEALLDAQARRIGLPQTKLFLPEDSSMASYQEQMGLALAPLVETGITHAVFGDIFLDDLRQWRELQLARWALTAVFPLWQQSSLQLLETFWAAGFRTVVVSVNSQYLDASFCGRVLDRRFVSDLPPAVDPCGENGEFHTFVYQAPYFSEPIRFQTGETVEKHYTYQTDTGAGQRSTYYFTDLHLVGH